MDLWTVIPVKPFGQGKSRLAGVLSAAERAALNCELFERVFAAAQGALGGERIVVVTADTALLTRVRRLGAHGLAEHAPGDLNAALAQATAYAAGQGATAMLVLPSDLPDIAAEDIAALGAAIDPAPCCVLAPDASGEGTNALALSPPCADFFRFGPRSFDAHSREAGRRGLPVRFVRRPGLAHDLDTPEAFRRFVRGAPNRRLRPVEDPVGP